MQVKIPLIATFYLLLPLFVFGCSTHYSNTPSIAFEGNNDGSFTLVNAKNGKPLRFQRCQSKQKRYSSDKRLPLCPSLLDNAKLTSKETIRTEVRIFLVKPDISSLSLAANHSNVSLSSQLECCAEVDSALRCVPINENQASLCRSLDYIVREAED